MNIIERIVQILEDKHLDQSDLCKVLSIRDSTFSTWKSRGTDPPAKYILLICEYLNVPVEYLLSGTDKPKAEMPEPSDKTTIEFLQIFQSLDIADRIAVMNLAIEKSKKH